MTAPYAELAACAVWVGVTLGGRGVLRRLDAVRCVTGDWGTSFLVGFSLYTTLVFLGALVGIPISAIWYVAAAALVTGGGIYLGRGATPGERKTLPAWTPAEVVLGSALLLYAVIVVVNAVFYPVAATDAFSYDGRARYMVVDGTLDLAMYHWPGVTFTGTNNLTYPPLFSLGLGVVYAFGGWQTKVLTAGFSLAWVLMLYGVLRQHLPRYACLAWTLLLGLTPEILSHASYALLNVPAMALILATAVFLERFTEREDRRWLALAAITGAGAAGIRPDAVAIHVALVGATLAALLLRSRGRRGLRVRLLALTAVAAAPLLTWGLWTLYFQITVEPPRISPLQASGVIGPWAMIQVLPRFLSHVSTYGPVFIVWPIGLVGILIRRRANRAALMYQVFSFTTLLTLIALFSMLDLDYGGRPQDVITSSFKRALFYVVPLAGLATALSPPWLRMAKLGRGVVHHQPVSESDS